MRLLSTCLLSAVLMGTAYADEGNVCATACTATLKECRKQADSSEMLESTTPFLSSSGDKARHENGLDTTLYEKGDANTAKSEVQRRKSERKLVCEQDHSQCIKLCSGAPATSKNSVVFKPASQN